MLSPRSFSFVKLLGRGVLVGLWLAVSISACKKAAPPGTETASPTPVAPPASSKAAGPAAASGDKPAMPPPGPVALGPELVGDGLVFRLRSSRGEVSEAGRQILVISANIVGRNLTFSETLHGPKADGSSQGQLTHTLTVAELARIEALIEGAKLMEAPSLEGPALTGMGGFVDLEMRLRRGNQRHGLAVAGATYGFDGVKTETALGKHPLHLQLVALAEALTEIAKAKPPR